MKKFIIILSTKHEIRKPDHLPENIRLLINESWVLSYVEPSTKSSYAFKNQKLVSRQPKNMKVNLQSRG